MFGVVSVQDTNRLLPLHDRQGHDLRGDERAQPLQELDVAGSSPKLAAMRLAGGSDCAEDRVLLTRQRDVADARVEVLSGAACSRCGDAGEFAFSYQE